MNIAILGSGGREHALCYKLKQSPKIERIYCIPGNAGTGFVATNLNMDISNFEEIYKAITKLQIDYVIVGPEQPLVNGIVDFLENKNIKVFGPNKFASKLEGSKAFMKNLCKENNIPTAKFATFDSLEGLEDFINSSKVPVVVKADGLAAGKGVTICQTKNDAIFEAKEILNGKFKSSQTVVIEEFLKGEELSYFILVNQDEYIFFGSAQDHKRVGEGETGLNTGGMGAYSPAPILDEDLENKIKNKIIEPTLKGLKKLGGSYKGILYAGLIICEGEPLLIEYNIRMGDPECQVIMTLLETDLMEIIESVLNNKIKQLKINWSSEKSMTIVLCANGYPQKYIKNSEIKNLSNIKLDDDDFIFHAGTYEKDKIIFSHGGRVLNITSRSKDFKTSKNRIFNILEKINWKDGFYRKDIGWRLKI